MHSKSTRRILATMLGLVTLLWVSRASGASSVPETCVAFSNDGSLSKGTVFQDGLKVALNVKGMEVTKKVEIHDSTQSFRTCEQGFSDDGRWIGAVVASDSLMVAVLDRSDGSVHRQFSLPWNKLNDHTTERSYGASYFGGFLPDDSMVIWRYVPQPRSSPNAEPTAKIHLQRWRVDGALLSDRNIGEMTLTGNVANPLPIDRFNLVGIPRGDRSDRGVKLSEAQLESAGTLTLPKDTIANPAAMPGNNGLVAVTGSERGPEKAVLLSPSATVQAEVKLPFFPNLLGPLVPDWFFVRQPLISSDGELAAIARSHVAWVLVDTDRDWGSEIIVIDLHRMTVVATVKTGRGGIGAVGIHHSDGTIRLM